MIRLLKCEYMKIKRCYIFLTAFILTVVNIFASFHADYSNFLRFGWRMFLYQLPLMNALFFPYMSTIIASRLCGIEHKGTMFNRLFCIVKREKIYDIKLVLGLAIMTASVVVSWGAAVIVGVCSGFEGKCPIDLYLLYLLFTLVPTLSIYVFQHTLSILFKNQAIAFFAGIIGEFIGVFSMFLPSLPYLRKLNLWGYYGVLQFVGLFDWTKETKYTYAHFDLLPVDWLFFGVLVSVTIIMYFTGRCLFTKKEV